MGAWFQLAWNITLNNFAAHVIHIFGRHTFSNQGFELIIVTLISCFAANFHIPSIRSYLYIEVFSVIRVELDKHICCKFYTPLLALCCVGWSFTEHLLDTESRADVECQMHGQNICIMTTQMSPLQGVSVRQSHS